MSRRGTKLLAEDVAKLKIVDLQKFGIISDGLVHELTWNYPSGVSFEANARLVDMGTDFSGETAQFVKLLYKIKGSTQDQEVTLTTTPCYFGGNRYWFKCPQCCKRIGVLYFADGYFACLHCQNITYHSRNINRRNWLYSYHCYYQTKKEIQTLKKRRLRYANKDTKYMRKLKSLINSNYQPNLPQFSSLF